MTYTLITPPAAEPVTLAEIKAHLRIDGDDEDALLVSLLGTAREHLEQATGLCLLSQSWRLALDRWPTSGILPIFRSPVREILSITVRDGDGAGTGAGNAIDRDVPLAGHLLDGAARPARLWLADPPRSGRRFGGIEIVFLAGFGDAATDVPDTLKRAISLHVGQMFAFRGAVSPDQQPAGIPDGYQRLIAPFSMRRL